MAALSLEITDGFNEHDGLKRSTNTTPYLGSDGMSRPRPKLAFRNKVADMGIPEDRVVTTIFDAGSENGSLAPSSPHSSLGLPTPTSERSLSNEMLNRRPDLKHRGPSSTSTRTNSSAHLPQKKKGSSMLGFLSLKEPSTNAWEAFAAEEKAKMKQRSGTGASSVKSGTSSQKLPGFVPKVNSKWDGLPDSASRKSEESKPMSRGSRNSTFSAATEHSNWTALSSMSAESRAARRLPNSQLIQPVHSPLRSHRASMRSTAQFSAGGRTDSSCGSTRQPPALAFDTDTDFVEVTDENKPQTFLRDPSPPPQDQTLIPHLIPPLSPPELVGDDILHLLELDPRTSDSGPTSPSTPPTDGSESRPTLMGIHYPELDSLEQDAAPANHMVSWLNDATESVEATKRPSSKQARQAVNFSRPRSRIPTLSALQDLPKPRLDMTIGRLSPADNLQLSPTLKDSTGRIDPFLTDTFASHSRETGHIPQRVASTIVKDKKGSAADAASTGAGKSITSLDDPSAGSSIQRPQSTRPISSTSTATALYDPEAAPLRSRSEESLAPSIAPSDMSESWHMSPMERLGLGSKVRKSEVMPWESEENPRHDTERERNKQLSVLPLPENRSRRLSWRLNVKR